MEGRVRLDSSLSIAVLSASKFSAAGFGLESNGFEV